MRYNRKIPDAYQYFHNQFEGGADGHIDYCPIIQPYMNGNCQDESNNIYADQLFG
jgi:hypothetical protein